MIKNDKPVIITDNAIDEQRKKLKNLNISIIQVAKTIGTEERSLHNYFGHYFRMCNLRKQAMYYCINTLIRKNENNI